MLLPYWAAQKKEREKKKKMRKIRGENLEGEDPQSGGVESKVCWFKEGDMAIVVLRKKRLYRRGCCPLGAVLGT